MTARTCVNCGGPIDPAARADRITCSDRCRKARARRRAAQLELFAEDPAGAIAEVKTALAAYANARAGELGIVTTTTAADGTKR